MHVYYMYKNTEKGRKWLYGFGLEIYMSSSEIRQSKCVSHLLLGSLVCTVYVGGGSPVSRQQCTRVGLENLKRPGSKTWRMNVWVWLGSDRSDMCMGCHFTEMICVWKCISHSLVVESFVDAFGLFNKNCLLIRDKVREVLLSVSLKHHCWYHLRLSLLLMAHTFIAW